MLRERLIDCLRGWSLRALVVTLYISKSASSSQHQSRLFSEPPSYTKENKIQNAENWKLNFVSAAPLCRWGGQINNFCVAYFLNILCVKYCRNQSVYVDTPVKWTGDCFFTHAVDLSLLSIFALWVHTRVHSRDSRRTSQSGITYLYKTEYQKLNSQLHLRSLAM